MSDVFLKQSDDTHLPTSAPNPDARTALSALPPPDDTSIALAAHPLWTSLITNAPLPLALVLGHEHHFFCVNTAFEQTSNTPAHQVLGRGFGEACPQIAEAGVSELLERVFRTGLPETAVTQAAQSSLDDQHGWTVTAWPVHDEHERRIGLVVYLQDTTEHGAHQSLSPHLATELRIINEQLLLTGLREQERAAIAVREALHDGLTGLPNRTLLLDRLAQTFPAVQRHPDPYALFLLDIDHFKAVNDTYGHLVGDQLLIQIARRLVQSLRPEDTVARMGGDEFAILLKENTETDEVMKIAERIQEHLRQPFTTGGVVITTSASIGIVHRTPAYHQPEELLRDADSALYQAKALGKACSIVFDATLQTQMQEKARLESDLRSAIAQNQLRLHYQPIISLATNSLIGVEALVRWQHPQRGLLAPAAFLPIAEETGQIVPLGEWVLQTACAQVSAWRTRYHRPMFVAVNLSARHFMQHNVRATIADALEQSDLAPDALHLELTENTLMEDIPTNLELLKQLTHTGIQLSVDDFGTGYSSLSYLRHLPFRTIKIDRSFVRDVSDNPNNQAIIAAIIAMAHRLEVHVIAEGIETEAQLAFLRAEGCDAVQGYLLSRPIPASELEPQLDRAHWWPPQTHE